MRALLCSLLTRHRLWGNGHLATPFGPYVETGRACWCGSRAVRWAPQSRASRWRLSDDE